MFTPSVPFCVTSHSVKELTVHSDLSVAIHDEAGCSFIWPTTQDQAHAAQVHRICKYKEPARFRLSPLEGPTSVHTGPWLIRGKPGHDLHPYSGNQKARWGWLMQSVWPAWQGRRHLDIQPQTSSVGHGGRPALIWNNDWHLLGSYNLAFFCSNVFVF